MKEKAWSMSSFDIKGTVEVIPEWNLLIRVSNDGGTEKKKGLYRFKYTLFTHDLLNLDHEALEGPSINIDAARNGYYSFSHPYELIVNQNYKTYSQGKEIRLLRN